MADALRVEVERGYEIRIQAHKEEDERAECNHDADQSRDSEKSKTALECVQPTHLSATVEERRAASRWIGRSVGRCCLSGSAAKFFRIEQGTARSTFD